MVLKAKGVSMMFLYREEGLVTAAASDSPISPVISPGVVEVRIADIEYVRINGTKADERDKEEVPPVAFVNQIA